MMGDLTGRTLVLFPERSAQRLCDILFRRADGATAEFGPMEQSGLKEVGNILVSAYMNALSDFMGMMLVPSVPSLVIDLSAARSRSDSTGADMNYGRRMASKMARSDGMSGRSRKWPSRRSGWPPSWNEVSTQKTKSRSWPKLR